MSVSFLPVSSKYAKAPVQLFADLPLVGNSDGDIRVVLSEDAIYTWNATGSIWVSSNSGVTSLNGLTPAAQTLVSGNLADLLITSLISSHTFNLVATGVTPGPYTNSSITVDAKGRITAASSGAGLSFPLLATPGGTPGAPAYSFAGGVGFSDKGLYSSAADQLDFAVGGAKKGHVGLLGLYIGSGPSTTAPYLSGITNLNFNFQSPGTQIGVIGRGFEQWRFYNDGTNIRNYSDTHIAYGYDNTHDLGVSGQRPRSILVGTNITINESGSSVQGLNIVPNASSYVRMQMLGTTNNFWIQSLSQSTATLHIVNSGSSNDVSITANADLSATISTQGGTNPIHPGSNNGQEFGGVTSAWKRFYAGGGTAALPAYTFGAAVGDNDNGMYLQATDAIGFATNGIKRLRIDQGSQTARMTLGNTDVAGLVEFLFEKDTAQTGKINFGDGCSLTGSNGKIEMVGPAGGLFRIDNSNNMQMGSGQLLGTSDGGFTIGYDEALSSGLRPRLLKVSEDIFVGGTASSTVSSRAIYFGSLLASTAKINSDGTGALQLHAANQTRINSGVKFRANPHGDIDYTILISDFYVSITAITAPRTYTLPTVASVGQGTMFIIKDESGLVSVTNTLTVDGAGAETIDGAANFVLTSPYESLTVICTGSAWSII